MILFYGKPADKNGDENVSRAARLEALRTHFWNWKHWENFDNRNIIHTFSTAVYNRQLDNADVPYLVLNAHGNDSVFSHFTPKEIGEKLIAAGLNNKTKEIWIAACCVGLQMQDNTHPEFIFIKELYRYLKEKGYDEIKVYGPRGLLTYENKKIIKVGNQETIRYESIVIDCTEDDPKDRKYSFEDGWVLAVLP